MSKWLRKSKTVDEFLDELVKWKGEIITDLQKKDYYYDITWADGYTAQVPERFVTIVERLEDDPHAGTILINTVPTKVISGNW
jgi:hypothetical protein